MTIDFSKEEINALATMIDMAVRAQGLQVAEAAVVLTNKLEKALKDAGETLQTSAPEENEEGAV